MLERPPTQSSKNTLQQLLMRIARVQMIGKKFNVSGFEEALLGVAIDGDITRRIDHRALIIEAELLT